MPKHYLLYGRKEKLPNNSTIGFCSRSKVKNYNFWPKIVIFKIKNYWQRVARIFLELFGTQTCSLESVKKKFNFAAGQSQNIKEH
jgi:hypothetical protein